MGSATSRGPVMTRVCWRLVEILSEMLDADERQAVRGDLTESGQTGSHALWAVLGLVVRRHVALGKDWWTWLVLVGLIGPVSILLSLSCNWINGSYDLYLWIIRNYRDIDPTVLSQTGLSVRPGIVLLARNSLLLFCWSWACGFVLGAMSRRSIRFNGVLFCFCLGLLSFLGFQSNRQYQYGVDGWPLPLVFYAAILPLTLQTILIWLPSLWGMHQALQRQSRFLQVTLWAVAVATALTVPSWFWWPGGWRMRLLLLAAYWPIVYLFATAVGRHWNRRTSAYPKHAP
jgi:hypothetical protein